MRILFQISEGSLLFVLSRRRKKNWISAVCPVEEKKEKFGTG
jgi:hypothetical protein